MGFIPHIQFAEQLFVFILLYYYYDFEKSLSAHQTAHTTQKKEKKIPYPARLLVSFAKAPQYLHSHLKL